MNNDLISCCMCGKTIRYNESHNPEPVMQYPARCCWECNASIVIPQRFKQWNKNN